jgi:hypothetical protein
LFKDFYQSGALVGLMRDWLPLVSSVVVFYVNYLIFIDKYFFTKKNVRFIVLNIVFFVVLILMYLAHEFVWKNFEHPVDKFRPRPSELYIFYSQFFSLVISTVVSIAVKSVRKNNQIEKRRKKLNASNLNGIRSIKTTNQPAFPF